MKLWAGRFQKETDTLVNDFNSSIAFDERMYRQDIQGSIAHATMLGEQGVITMEESLDIIQGLQAILQDIEDGKVEFSMENEDIHMNIEAMLTSRIGPDGKRLHTGRSRNDQVAVDFRLYVKQEIPKIIGMLLDLQKVLVAKAQENTQTVMPGYTHLQRAQPTTFAHYMMAYANMIRRDVTRLEDCLERMDECPLGAGALATSSYPINRQRTAELLGFKKPTENSMDSVSDRDFALEFLSACSILMMHLSRFSEEIILWCSWEFKFVDHRLLHHAPEKEPRRGRVGPGQDRAGLRQPHYPFDRHEGPAPGLQQGHAGGQGAGIRRHRHGGAVYPRVLRHGQDHDRPAQEYAAGSLRRLHQRHRLRRLPDQKGHALPGGLHDRGPAGDQLPQVRRHPGHPDFRAVSGLFDGDIYDALALKTCVNGRKVMGGPAEEEVKRQIAYIQNFVEEHSAYAAPAKDGESND